MFLVKDPGQYQVIVTNNLFGDIVTDIGGALQGGLGMAASGNIHPGKTSLFEPVHGSAPPLAGKNVANPIGAILSTALLLETLGARDESKAIEAAVEASIAAGQTTTDIGGTLGTTAAGDFMSKTHNEEQDKRITNMKQVFILGGARTPMTTHVGALKDFSAIDLGAIASKAALERTGTKPEWVDHVVFGNVQQSSVDAHLRRASRRPEGGSADRSAGAHRESPLRIRHSSRDQRRAAHSGDEAGFVLAGGMESMSQVPHVIRGARSGSSLARASSKTGCGKG